MFDYYTCNEVKVVVQNQNKFLRSSTLIIILSFVIISTLIPLGFNIHKEYLLGSNYESASKHKEDVSTFLISKIQNKNTKNSLPFDKESSIQAINPTIILRGNTFVASGRLVDSETGLGISGQQIFVFWE